MSIVLDGTAGITTPEITSAGGPLVVNASAPDNSVVVDASGNLGIGTSSPLGKLHSSSATSGATPSANGNQVVAENSGNAGITIASGATSLGNIFFADSGDSADGYIQYDQSGRSMRFGTATAERARIDSSGNFLVGTTVNGRTDTNGTAIDPTGVVYQNHVTGTVSGTFFTRFSLAATQIGSISQSGTTAVAYNTSSDYRLKHDIQPMTGALAKVAALKPCTYKWNADDSAGEGFIAHELAEVVPQAVTGEKNAVDAEGNPEYQGIDTSFLVATLTAAIQEQQALIESLTARVVALEGQA